MRAESYKPTHYEDQHPFAEGAVFLKGNLHTHTTLSDGKVTPEDTLKAYAGAGYDFLAITDHYLYIDRPQWDTDGMLLLPGVEVNYDDGEHRTYDHLVAVQTDFSKSGYEDGKQVVPYAPSSGIWGMQRMVEELRKTGHFVIYAHPHWSRRDANWIAQFEGIDAVEVYNTCCDVNYAAGDSDIYYDDLLIRGKRIYAAAVDDTHNTGCFFGGWVTVKAKEKSRAAIGEALRAGRFYASTGPEIYDYCVENGVVKIDCSPAASVSFVTFDHWGGVVRGEAMTHAEYRLRGDEAFCRIIVRDAAGNRAWTQALYFI